MTWKRTPSFTVELRKARAGKRQTVRGDKQPVSKASKPKPAILGPIAREVAAALKTHRFPRHWFN